MIGAPGPARVASRCGECHGVLHAGWSASGHARSNRAPLYLAMRRDSEPAACDPCHAPLSRLLEPGDRVAEEGVTCDACHMLKDVEAGGAQARLTYALAEETRWGTICDAQGHYFHKTGCSPLFKEARLCAGCHRWSMRSPGGQTLRVLTEVDEWEASPAAAAGKTCQACHMRPTRDEVATGWQRQTDVGGHDLLGEGKGLRRDSVRVKVRAEEQQAGLNVEVELTNAGGAHAAPTGFPGRQLALELSLLDAAGEVRAREERVYARVLVDGAGREVPFHAAHREASDNRLIAGETRRESFSFGGVAGASALRARLLWRSVSPAIAAAAGVPAEEQVLTESRVSLRRPAGGAR